MNRLVLIGNGFDLAHGLPTKYEHFINWYWAERIRKFKGNMTDLSEDSLCKFRISYGHTWNSFYNQWRFNYGELKDKEIIEYFDINHDYFTIEKSEFLKNICESIKTKRWVDIENEYYSLLVKYSLDKLQPTKIFDLNNQLKCVTDNLIDYLQGIDSSVCNKSERIKQLIYEPIRSQEVSIGGKVAVTNYLRSWMNRREDELSDKIGHFDFNFNEDIKVFNAFMSNYRGDDNYDSKDVPVSLMLPDTILLLDFNYTRTTDMYCNSICYPIHIHGKVRDKESVIFGYGDELDSKYSELQGLNDNECLRFIKSIRYLESDNYRKTLDFIESSPYQVYIMGHSCGNSDRTLLNTIFEHKNCISIKPFYHKKDNGVDNYLEIVQNISRNFTDMKLMRDRVVNKTYCEPLTV